MPRKKPLKTCLWKSSATKIHLLSSAFLKLSKLEMLFQKQELISLFLQHRNKAKAANFTKDRRETCHCTYCHAISKVIWFYYFMIFNYDFIMQSFLTCQRKIVQFLQYINPVVDSDDEDDDIFEPGSSFSFVFYFCESLVCKK